MAIPHDSWRRLACILFRQLVRKSSARRQPYLSIFVQPDEKAYSAIRTPERCGIAKKTEIVFNKYKGAVKKRSQKLCSSQCYLYLQESCGKMLKKAHTFPYPKRRTAF